MKLWEYSNFLFKLTWITWVKSKVRGSTLTVSGTEIGTLTTAPLIPHCLSYNAHEGNSRRNKALLKTCQVFKTFRYGNVRFWKVEAIKGQRDCILPLETL